MVAQEQKVDRASTGGTNVRRSNGEAKGTNVDGNDRRNSTGTRVCKDHRSTGTLGGASDPELWRAIRYDRQWQSGSNGDLGPVLIQSAGMPWWKFREGPLRTYGGFLALAL